MLRSDLYDRAIASNARFVLCYKPPFGKRMHVPCLQHLAVTFVWAPQGEIHGKPPRQHMPATGKLLVGTPLFLDHGLSRRRPAVLRDSRGGLTMSPKRKTLPRNDGTTRSRFFGRTASSTVRPVRNCLFLRFHRFVFVFACLLQLWPTVPSARAISYSRPPLRTGLMKR